MKMHCLLPIRDWPNRHFFGLYSFSYLAEEQLLTRRLPRYEQSLAFELRRVELVFESSPPFYFRHGLKKLLQILFNLTTYTQEFYEENCCYLFPCYEISFLLKRK
ncbi:MAG: hypothetical protein L0387_09830 [Acidobacteria bacterium]|nr:hypothetical protein [Acidobacteriota bacterium]MCI0721148.1 hypothetical protein [Acidobacteriota bacterium]